MRSVFPLSSVAVLASFHSSTFILSAAAVGLGIGLLVGIRRIDLDAQGVTLVPLFPLRRKQTFRWSDLGTFYRNTSRMYAMSPAMLQAAILAGKPYRVMGVYQKWNLTIPAILAPTRLGSALGADTMFALLDSYRS